jgi:hypothetical protein
MPEPSPRFEDALRRIDAANGGDPDRVTKSDGDETTAALLYSRRMSAWLARLFPDAPDALQLAARAQHIRRWEIQRDQFPMDRAGYHRWRTTLYRFHADTAATILKESGYDDATIDRVGSLLRKERLKTDPLMQSLEDVICLVFLDHYFAAFIEQHDDEKVIGILRRTWAKMSPAGHAAAAGLVFTGRAANLLSRALASTAT